MLYFNCRNSFSFTKNSKSSFQTLATSTYHIKSMPSVWLISTRSRLRKRFRTARRSPCGVLAIAALSLLRRLQKLCYRQSCLMICLPRVRSRNRFPQFNIVLLRVRLNRSELPIHAIFNKAKKVTPKAGEIIASFSTYQQRLCLRSIQLKSTCRLL